jgi:hypothetical protein
MSVDRLRRASIFCFVLAAVGLLAGGIGSIYATSAAERIGVSIAGACVVAAGVVLGVAAYRASLVRARGGDSKE